MTRRRMRIGVAAMAVCIGACGGGGGSGSAQLSLAATTTTSTTTTTPTGSTTTTSTTLPRTTATTGTATTATTATTRVTPPGQPTVVATPANAPPGARVTIAGDGFTDEHWKSPDVPLYLNGGRSGCDFFAQAIHDVKVSAAGRLTGSFVVPNRGNCRQDTSVDVPVLAGTYWIVYQCTACLIGQMEVSVSVTSAAACSPVGFTPNSDNVARDILAYGLTCDEAVTVVTKVARPFGPVNGAARGEADGFTCVRTGERDGPGLPVATYECTRGSQRITFTRT